jgi:adenylate kinase
MKKIFLGPPGSGKGTAASRIAPKFNTPHISTGDLFRENIKKETHIGIKAKEYIKKGMLVPDEIVIEMLKNRIQQEDCQKGFILDGFPRTILQAKKLAEIIDIDIVINMNVSNEIIIKRLSSRVTCKDCGEVFNTINVKPKEEGKCDKCQGKIIKRPDDEPEIIQNRLNTYKEQTAPLIDFYKNKGVLQNVICNNINQTANETAQAVLDATKEFINNIQEKISNTLHLPKNE